MTRFRGTHILNVRRAGTSFSQLQIRPKRPDPCPGLSPDSLVQREQECVSDPFSEPGRAFATKADIYWVFNNIIIMMAAIDCQLSV